MMNFSLAIPTWVNVKRIKGKPAYHPFSTHISAFSVHDDDFSGLNLQIKCNTSE